MPKTGQLQGFLSEKAKNPGPENRVGVWGIKSFEKPAIAGGEMCYQDTKPPVPKAIPRAGASKRPRFRYFTPFHSSGGIPTPVCTLARNEKQ